jgi:hypothetical protein
MGVAALRMAEKRSWNRVFDELINNYSEALSEQKGARR